MDGRVLLITQVVAAEVVAAEVAVAEVAVAEVDVAEVAVELAVAAAVVVEVVVGWQQSAPSFCRPCTKPRQAGRRWPPFSLPGVPVVGFWID